MERGLKMVSPMTSFADYRIVRRIGIGGMASVYLARPLRGRRRPVALKRSHACVAGDLREEARLASASRHPNVVRVIDATDDAIVMGWVNGIDLACVDDVELPIDVVVALARDVLEGLEAVHRASIIHGDVSPENVLVGLDGVARLTDFGLARETNGPSSERDAVDGKLGYLAPEQLQGRADARIDIHAAGIVLWELLTGRRLRTATHGVDAFVRILYDEPLAPSAHRADAACLDDIVMRALARDPDDRFATPHAMLQCITRHVAPAPAARVADVVAHCMTKRSATMPERSPTDACPATSVNHIAKRAPSAMLGASQYVVPTFR